MAEHDPGAHHPEATWRHGAALSRLEGLDLSWRQGPEASVAALCAVHDSAYVEAVLGTRGQPVWFDADTVTSERSIEASLRAAGAAVAAVDEVLHGSPRGFVVARPPGHHAERARAMGFCWFNTVAIAAQHAVAQGLQRIAIVDWDVHHGNGTQHLFEDRSDVFFASTHRWPGFYPGSGAPSETGRDEGSGYTLNAVLNSGAGDDPIVRAFDEAILPALDRYQPELILVSAGFDAHADDPLGGLSVSDEGFRALARRVCDLSERHGEGRVLMLLEGGYDAGALGRCVRVCLEELAR